MAKQISQREARRLKKRVEELELNERVRFNSYRSDYPGGVNIVSFGLNDVAMGKLDTAAKLGCALVIRTYGGGIKIYAILKKQNDA